MDFDLTKEQEMIRKEVRKFAEAEIAPVAAELDETETFSVTLTKKMGEIGASVLAITAGEMLFFQKEEAVRFAGENGICIVALDDSEFCK